KSMVSAGFDCSSRKLARHGGWCGPLEAKLIHRFETDLPLPKKTTLHSSSWPPDVLRKAPRV
ncbi:MAG: hypothetical protein AAAC48_09390, partial [Phyllobacterium sp.]|uniref:hypothetical protein n=1 Tax=Phyllobacterium sp. TaxID=1871046 RepID=UPI0030F2112D